MVNVMKHNYLYATLLSEFKYVADDTLLNAIKNEDMNEQKMIFTEENASQNYEAIRYPCKDYLYRPLNTLESFFQLEIFLHH